MRRDELTCTECARRFWSEFVEMRHRKGGRCRTDADLRRIGLHLNPAGVWVRPNPLTECRQLRLFPVRGRRWKARSDLRGGDFLRSPRRRRGIGQGRLLDAEVAA